MSLATAFIESGRYQGCLQDLGLRHGWLEIVSKALLDQDLLTLALFLQPECGVLQMPSAISEVTHRPTRPPASARRWDGVMVESEVIVKQPEKHVAQNETFDAYSTIQLWLDRKE